MSDNGEGNTGQGHLKVLSSVDMELASIVARQIRESIKKNWPSYAMDYLRLCDLVDRYELTARDLQEQVRQRCGN